MSPFEKATVGQKLLTMFLYVLYVSITAVAYLLGVTIGIVTVARNFVNVKSIVGAFLAGLVIWPLWSYCLAPASPYFASPISYLQAIGLFVLFRLFFGNLFPAPRVFVGENLSGDEKKLVEIYRKTSGTPTYIGGNYSPGDRQAYRPTEKSSAGDDRPAGDGVGGRKENTKARA